jgi:hypothetical protein
MATDFDLCPEHCCYSASWQDSITLPSPTGKESVAASDLRWHLKQVCQCVVCVLRMFSCTSVAYGGACTCVVCKCVYINFQGCLIQHICVIRRIVFNAYVTVLNKSGCIIRLQFYRFGVIFGL